MTVVPGRARSERGSVLIAGLLLTLSVLLVLGAAVDIGRAFIVRRELVAKADDAALAGSQALDPQALHQGQLILDPEQARQTALQSVEAQPGLQADIDASTGTVVVRLQERIPTLLLRLAGLSSLTVSAQATAAPRAP